MPEMNGYEFIKAIREKSKIPAVMLTSVGVWGDRKAFRKLGNIEYLTKPVKQSILFNSIIDLMGVKDKDKKKKKKITDNYKERFRSLPENIRILLVEDNLINQRVAAAIIERAGIHLDIAGDGLEAVIAVQNTKYSLVLMDVQMPEWMDLWRQKKSEIN